MEGAMAVGANEAFVDTFSAFLLQSINYWNYPRFLM
jgi:hypothetical protein